MTTIANILVLIVAAIHIIFAAGEFFVYTRHKLFAKFKINITNFDANFPQIGRIVINAAAFNALIGIGLIVSLLGSGEQGWLLKIYLLLAIIVAGIVGGLTLAPMVAVAQSVPAAIALVVVLLAR